jgi:hypothetical protein
VTWLNGSFKAIQLLYEAGADLLIEDNVRLRHFEPDLILFPSHRLVSLSQSGRTALILSYSKPGDAQSLLEKLMVSPAFLPLSLPSHPSLDPPPPYLLPLSSCSLPARLPVSAGNSGSPSLTEPSIRTRVRPWQWQSKGCRLVLMKPATLATH